MVESWLVMRLSKLLLLFVLFATSAPVVFGGVITSAVGVKASDERVFSSLFYADDSLIDQSGLSIGYQSGITDFESYIGLSPTHLDTANNTWATNNGVTTATIDFEFDGTRLLDGLALWNRSRPEPPQIKDFELYASDNAAFTGATFLGSFSAAAEPLQVFDFSRTEVAYLRMNILSQQGGSILSAGEIAFREQFSAVPEPTSVALWSLGLVGMAFTRRRTSN